MKAKLWVAFLAGAMLVAFVFNLASVFLVGSHNIHWKAGQIDALNGKVHMKLVEQEDGSTEWEYQSEPVEQEPKP